MGRAWAAGLLAVTVVGASAACSAPRPDPERVGTVVVAVGHGLGSLNAATAAGRTPGSTLVRGLVQGGFVSLDDAGEAVFDASFGTVAKTSDSPLTVRYTIDPAATWSDGVPVTPADLMLEWAARSGQLDEVVPGLADDGTLADPAALDGVVAFAAASPALVHATAVPTIDGATFTVVYDRPVADWAVALDVNLPAHVVGRLALDAAHSTATPAASSDGLSAGPTSTPASSGTTSSDATSSGPVTTPTPTPPGAWAERVTAAITGQQRDALVAVSRVWRTGFDAAALAADPSRAVTTGPYRLGSVADDRIELVADEAYRRAGAAAFDRIVVRTDLDPLAQVDALKAGQVDVAVPVTADDVRDALDALDDRVVVREGGDAVLQLQLQQAGAGIFDRASHVADGTDGAAGAAATRTAFLAAVPRAELAGLAGAEVSDLVLPEAGPARVTAALSLPAATAPGGTVRVLVNEADPVRSAMLDALTAAESAAGFDVVVVQTDDLAASYWSAPDTWDVALVPATPDELPVASVVARWRTGGATNATGHADAALDAVLDPLAGSLDAAAVDAGLAQVSASLVAAGAVLPLARPPVLTATAVRPDPDLYPAVDPVPALAWTAADQTAWWSWARARS